MLQKNETRISIFRLGFGEGFVGAWPSGNGGVDGRTATLTTPTLYPLTGCYMGHLPGAAVFMMTTNERAFSNGSAIKFTLYNS